MASPGGGAGCYMAETGALPWWEVREIPTPAELISSPYDPEARYSSKRSVDWVGFKGPLD
jgi:transposase